MLIAIGAGMGCFWRGDDGPETQPPPPAVQEEFVWQDLLTDDLESSRTFYGELLGWEFEETSRFGRPYLLARTVLGYIGGFTFIDREPGDPPVAQWLSYLLVADVEQTIARVDEHGGRTVIEPFDHQDGRVAVVMDPQGGLLGLTSVELGLPSRDPRVAPSGTFFWRDYLAYEVDAAHTFFTNVTGLAAEMQERADERPHYVLSQSREVAGVVPLPPEGVTPHWLPYLRVEDPGLLARRVESLGGRVLLAPSPEIRDGSLAIVADPRGATVALQKYPF